MIFRILILSLTIFFSALQMSYCQVLNDSLVGYYPFNGNANDESGYNHHCTVENAKLTTDRFGNENSAYYFDGNAGLFGNFDMRNFPSITISAWVKTNFTARQATVVFFEHSTVMYTNRFSAGKSITGFDGSSSDNDASQESKTIVTDDNWVLLTAVNDGKNAYIYVDDVLENFFPEKFADEDGTMSIGWQENRLWGFVGSIDDVRIYTRAISADEVKHLYEQRSTPPGKKISFCTLEDNFIIHPNPTLGKIKLKNLPDNILTMRLIDMAGRVIYDDAFYYDIETDELELSVCQPGTYIMQLFTRDKICTQKLVIQ